MLGFKPRSGLCQPEPMIFPQGHVQAVESSVGLSWVAVGNWASWRWNPLGEERAVTSVFGSHCNHLVPSPNPLPQNRQWWRSVKGGGSGFSLWLWSAFPCWLVTLNVMSLAYWPLNFFWSLFKSFAHFRLGCLSSYWLVRVLYILWISVLGNRVVQTCYLNLWLILSFLPSGEQNSFILIKSK